MMDCPKCKTDITDSYEPDDWSVGVIGGWYCDTCDLPINDHLEPIEGDVGIAPSTHTATLGTPLSEISGRPGHPGYSEFVRIAKSWGYD